MTRADLAAMVVPKRELGPLARGLSATSESGPVGNGEAADDTVDPTDTARTMRRAGRIAGYDLTYAMPKAAATTREARLRLVDTSVELFRAPNAAGRYLEKQIADYERFRGRRVDGVTIAESERFHVDGVGNEAEGVRLTLTFGRDAAFVTLVGFRRDQVVGAAVVMQATDFDMSEETQKIAAALADRIERVAAGQPGRAARAPVGNTKAEPDPKQLTLAAADVGLGGSPLVARYLRARAWRAYLREYDRPSGRLGTSKLLYLRTAGEVYDNAGGATSSQRYLATSKGRKSITRQFLRRWLRKTSFRPRHVEARPLSWGPKDTAGYQFFFDVPKGVLEGVVLSVAHGRLRASVLALGFDGEVERADVLRLRGRLRSRLRSGAEGS